MSLPEGINHDGQDTRFVTVVHVVVSLAVELRADPTPFPVSVQNCSLNPNCIVRVWADVLTR